MEGKIFSFLLHSQKAVEIHCDEEAQESLLGNIYIGKIKNIAKNIGAAFVEIAPGQTCYLPLDDMKQPVYTHKGTSKQPQAGDELLVQVSREGIKSKFPSVTTNLVLHGKYALLTTGNCQYSVSSKLSKEVRTHLLALLHALEGGKVSDAQHPEIQETQSEQSEQMPAGVGNTTCRSYGWLLRTNAGTADEALLTGDMVRLKKQYQTLMQQVPYRTCFSCLYRTPAAYLTRLSNLYDNDAGRIVTDDKKLFEEIHSYLQIRHPEDLEKLSLYQDELLPMKKLYSLEHQLKEALQERVWMKSGGYLVIQPTEALTVIDVNTGKFEGGKNREAAFLKINLEAASEIAHQIRLRNLSGIILVDFINMETEASNKELLTHLDRELRRDPVPTVLVDMTKLSLVEITRKKKERPLSEAFDTGFYESFCG